MIKRGCERCQYKKNHRTSFEQEYSTEYPKEKKIFNVTLNQTEVIQTFAWEKKKEDNNNLPESCPPTGV